jgi:hypothetical protein
MHRTFHRRCFCVFAFIGHILWPILRTYKIWFPPPSNLFIQEPLGVTSQKTAIFIVCRKSTNLMVLSLNTELLYGISRIMASTLTDTHVETICVCVCTNSQTYWVVIVRHICNIYIWHNPFSFILKPFSGHTQGCIQKWRARSCDKIPTSVGRS